MRNKQDQEPVEMEVYMFHETDSAILVGDIPNERKCKNQTWLPKSQISFEVKNRRTGLIELSVPEWLAIDKGLV